MIFFIDTTSMKQKLFRWLSGSPSKRTGIWTPMRNASYTKKGPGRVPAHKPIDLSKQRIFKKGRKL